MNRVAELLAKGVGEPTSRAAQHAVDVATMRQVAQARAMRMQRALKRFCEMLQDSANLRAGLILIPVPWGASGRWGLTRDERGCLRRIIVTGRINRASGRRITAPWSYDETSRRWVLRGTADDAANWVENWPLTANDVLAQWVQRRSRK